MLLEIKGISVCYVESNVCQSIELDIENGEAVCLLGRNGVGKTTLLKSIIGLLKCTEGRVVFEGRDIANSEPYKIAQAGIGYVPQGRMIFSHLSVADNLKLGTMGSKSSKKIPELIFEYFPALRDRLKQRGGTLSGGQQQMLAVGRALAGNPKLLLLDEPTEGLSAGAVRELTDMLKRLIRDTGIGILLVEQNLEMAMETCSRGYVMEKGCIVANGNTDELQKDEIVLTHLVI